MGCGCGGSSSRPTAPAGGQAPPPAAGAKAETGKNIFWNGPKGREDTVKDDG